VRRIQLEKIKTKRDLQIALSLLDSQWKHVFEIKDTRKRYKEIIKLRRTLQGLLDEYKRNIKKDIDSNKNNIFRKTLGAIENWLRLQLKSVK
tara:strand:+ start:634 stop:909 length:276 start_codon:yes stop_codon:yes gene_type:complete